MFKQSRSVWYTITSQTYGNVNCGNYWNENCISNVDKITKLPRNYVLRCVNFLWNYIYNFTVNCKFNLRNKTSGCIIHFFCTSLKNPHENIISQIKIHYFNNVTSSQYKHYSSHINFPHNHEKNYHKKYINEPFVFVLNEKNLIA